GQVVKEGEGGGVFQQGQTRAQAGSMGGFNLNWDATWQVATSIDANGWYAEFRIPFSTLRYGSGTIQDWGLNFARSIRRHNEEALWSFVPRQFNLYRLSRAGTLKGIAVPSRRVATVTPYVLSQSSRNFSVDPDMKSTGEVGADLKYGVTPSLTLDLTYNTDFAQVEVDEQRTNLTRFPLFFPEKRPFFLEGADILQAPLNALYTRSVTDPAWGARATQRSERFDGTVLVTRDDGGGLVLLPNTYGTGFAPQDFKSMATFARGRWQVGGATLGFLATDRTLEDSRGYNRVAGLDFAWFPDTEKRLRAQVMGSSTTALPQADGRLAKGEAVNDHAVLLDWRLTSPRWDLYADFEDVGREFRADNGFFFQNGYRRLYGEAARKFLELWGFNEVSPYMNLEYKTDPDGNVQYQQNNVGVRWGLPRATTVFTEVRVNNLVGVRPEGGLRKRDQVFFGIESNPFPWFAKLYSEVAYGDRVDVANNRVGKGAFVTVQASLRPHPRIELEYRIDNDHIDAIEDVEGSKRILTERAQQLLGLYHFTSRDSVRLIWQERWVRRAPSLWEEAVSSREENSTVSLVYGHRRGIGTSFYLGATWSRALVADTGFKASQVELFAKGSWSFDLL
ncbi:MAG TPA: DUF5916 domain-containing protein, partial [Usitatibacter sp.]|nr:DUF5916 domain-containing protein [Usitatibacter sp.]